MRSTKNRFTHNSMLRDWIYVLVCRCSYNFYNSGTDTALTERLDKTTLNTLQRTLTAHSLKWITDCMVYKNMDTFITSTKRVIINGTFTNNYMNRFNGRYVIRFLNRFDKRIMNRFKERNTDIIRNWFTGRQRCWCRKVIVT